VSERRRRPLAIRSIDPNAVAVGGRGEPGRQDSREPLHKRARKDIRAYHSRASPIPDSDPTYCCGFVPPVRTVGYVIPSCSR
jgi:hypothetical protein